MPSTTNAPMIGGPGWRGGVVPTRHSGAPAPRRARRHLRTLGTVAALALALAACADDDDAAPADGEQQESATAMAPALDVEARTAESDGVEMEVTATGGDGTTWVAALDEDLFVAVVDEGEGTDRQVLAFLCDGDTVAEWLTAEEAADEITLTGNGTTMQVALTDDEATGTVTVDGGEPVHFTAEPATGDAGLYQGETLEGDTRHTGAWIVLDDGRQRGWWWRAEGNEEEEELQM
jgi:hypothetical protein